MQAVIQLEQAVENDCKPNIGLHFGKAGSREVILSFAVSKNEMVFVSVLSFRKIQMLIQYKILIYKRLLISF
jgi:hypothetical protein